MDVIIKSMASLLQLLDIFQKKKIMEIMDVVSRVGCKTTNPLDLLVNFHRF
jgi:ACT domain-containing protein